MNLKWTTTPPYKGGRDILWVAHRRLLWVKKGQYSMRADTS